VNKGRSGKTVLLVDDDADFIDLNRRLLEEAGYTVHAAYNSRECLEKASRRKPGLIILDMVMDRENEGFDLSRELRNREYTKDIPLVMITSVNDKIPFRVEPDRTWLPVDALIEKPVDPKLLLDVVERILGG
jgi:CheY-like chemotaxis protein